MKKLGKKILSSFRKGTRGEQEIFEELSRLCITPGYIHAIAHMIVRDNMIFYKDGLKADDMQVLHRRGRLLRSEFNVLIGLMIKEPIDYTIPPLQIQKNLVESSDRLMRELHDSIGGKAWEGFSLKNLEDKGDELLTGGNVLREAIFYAADSAFSFQYRDFILPKYSADSDWLHAKHGYTIQECHRVIETIGKIRNDDAADTLREMSKLPYEQQTCLPCNVFTAEEVANHSGLAIAVVEKVLASFTLDESERNTNYKQLHDFNIVTARPLIKNGSQYFLSDIYCLTEAAFQSPYYWMYDDKAYKETARENRGNFTENFSADRLTTVFGKDNVHKNVNIYKGKDIVGEIDVLVIFGDRLIILQAKSKQLTMAARKGDEEWLKDDFKKAVQLACNQGVDCAQHILSNGVTLKATTGETISLNGAVQKIYLMCVVADHYPSLSFQASQFLKFPKIEKIAPPFVMDIFFLDVLTEMLDTPLYLLSYVDRRTGYRDAIMSSVEHTVLSYHLTQNLWLSEEHTFVMLEDDISTPLDAAMMVRREGMPGEPIPDGILTRIQASTLGKVLKQIEREPHAAMIAFGFAALSMSEDTANRVSAALEMQSSKARSDQGVHDFSLKFTGRPTGLTVHFSSPGNRDRAIENLKAYCELRKYVERADEWFALILNPLSYRIEFGGHLLAPWERNSQLDELTADMKPGKSLGKTMPRPISGITKVGRNEPCPCGSGKKYKKCCLQSA